MAGAEVADVGYLIHRRRLRETSFLLQFFTRDHGRIALVARGAISSRRPATTVNEFALLYLAWQGRGDLPNLRRHDAAGRPHLLSGDRVFSGLYVNELLSRLLGPHDPSPAVWSAYESVLHALASADEIEGPLREFEARLLDACGYGLSLDHAADDDSPVRADITYAYLPEHGPVQGNPSGTHQRVTGSTLLALAGVLPWSEDALREAKSLMRFLLQPHLGGRPLVSRSLFARQSRAERALAPDAETADTLCPPPASG